jgi:peptidoglycan hydrolase-like protein with peptidoglycan-binding domain
MFACALTPGAALAAGGGSPAARPASAHAKQETHPRRRSETISRRRRSAARTYAKPHAAVLLSPGSGYRQTAGSRRVRVLQRRLASSGFAPGPIDGRYGPLTTRAVIRFQADQGLRVDGLAGVQTLTRLRVIVSGGPLTRALPDRRGARTRVRELPLRVARLSYRHVPISGLYLPPTGRALTRYRNGPLSAPAFTAARTPRLIQARPSGAGTSPVSGDSPVPLLVGLAAACGLGVGVLSRRSRVLPRRRRYVSSRTLMIARLAGFRYSPQRKASVLRIVGNRFGPVLKPTPHDLARQPKHVPRITTTHHISRGPQRQPHS